MINFILGYDFEQIRARKNPGEPFNIFKPIKLFYNSISEVSISVDSQNKLCICFSLTENTPLTETTFLHFPIQLISADIVKISNGDMDDEICLSEYTKVGGSQRLIAFKNSLSEFKKLTFSGVFNNTLPAELNSSETIIGNLERDHLLEVYPNFVPKEIKFIYFSQLLHIKQYCFYRFSTEALFIYDSTQTSGLIIDVETSAEKTRTIDFQFGDSRPLSDYFKDKYIEYFSKNLSYQIFLWSADEKFYGKVEGYLSEKKQKLLKISDDKILKFLQSDYVLQKVAEVKRSQLLDAVKKLDYRKEILAEAPKIITPGKFKFRVPSNEYETVILFSALVAEGNLPFAEFELHEYASNQGIDAIASYKVSDVEVKKDNVATEFEYKFSNYFKHGHPIQHTEIIICWVIDNAHEGLKPTSEKWLYKLDIDGNTIPVVEMKNFDFW